MQKLIISDGTTRYTRISKAEARKRFNRGESVYWIAHKMRPGMPFSLGMIIDGARNLQDWNESYPDGKHPTVPGLTAFDRALGEFCYYNANCHETGTYAAFYLTKDA